MKRRWIQILMVVLGITFQGSTIQPQTTTHPKLTAPGTTLTPSPASPTANPEGVGLSSERLTRIAGAMQKSVEDGRISGGVALVARHGKIAYLQAVGMADREARKPMRTDTIFRICSMTKPITAVAVMILYEEGRFELSDPVSNYLPEFKHMKVLDPPWPQDTTSPAGALVDAKRQITIFDLLTHTAGLSYPPNDRLNKEYLAANVSAGLFQTEGTIADGVKRIATVPLLFQPGVHWKYSLAFDVLGRLVEVVSGMPFDKFLEQRIFHPLGMKDTYFFLPEDKVSRLAAAYAYTEQKGLHVIPDNQVTDEGGSMHSADYPYRGPRTYFSGGGGLCSTAEDYFRFCQMMLNNGELNGARILSRKSVDLMTMNHTQGKPGGPPYGLGFGVNSDPNKLTELGSLGSYYWSGFYFTRCLIDPKEDLITIFMTQLFPWGGTKIDFETQTMTYQAIEK
jgi:CubicO group peptidase (beta-lactamase class C family)